MSTLQREFGIATIAGGRALFQTGTAMATTVMSRITIVMNRERFFNKKIRAVPKADPAHWFDRKMKEIRRVPYRLPELIKSDQTIAGRLGFQ